ncbi:MAG: DUF2840 domain-containing protein [Pseudomonadota bacterium]
MANNLTAVSIAWRKRRRNHRLLFGTPYRWVRLNWRRRLAVFQPDQIFGYERWHANKYGTQSWQIFVVKAVSPTMLTQRIPGIMPGGELLLFADGPTASKCLLKTFDRLAKSDPLELFSECRWRQISCLQSADLLTLAHLNMDA